MNSQKPDSLFSWWCVNNNASGFSHSRPAKIAMAKAGISLRLDHQLKLVAKKSAFAATNVSCT